MFLPYYNTGGDGVDAKDVDSGGKSGAVEAQLAFAGGGNDAAAGEVVKVGVELLRAREGHSKEAAPSLSTSLRPP